MRNRMPDTTPEEIGAENPQDVGSVSTEHRFEPLSLCPDSSRRRYKKLEAKAKRGYAAAVKLKCIDCCAWYYP